MKRNSFIIITFALLLPFIVKGQQFSPIWPSPYNPMTFYFTAAMLNEGNLQPGDEIGIFDIDPSTGTEICVGAGVLNFELTGGAYLEMITSMDDGSSPGEANGFTPGNDFIFKIYSQVFGMIEEVGFEFPYPGYDENFASQGNAFIELYGIFTPGITFQPVWTSPYNPMTFYITQALLDGVDLNASAQIGIFDIDPNTGGEICVGAATLTGIISQQSYLELITSMDDGTLSGHANGFQPGNSFIFKYITQSGDLIETVVYDFPYPGYHEVFNSQGSAIVDLAGTTPQNEQHLITLSKGWSGISSWLDPVNPDIEALFSSISGQLEMLQNLEIFYQPGNSASSLGEWDVQSGYFIKVSSDLELVIDGMNPQNTSVAVQQGWNLIPILTDQPVNIETLFSGNLSKVIIIRDAVGSGVYWPDKSITTLVELQPGKSYLIKVSEGFSVDF
jgi:hypothetical protein